MVFLLAGSHDGLNSQNAQACDRERERESNRERQREPLDGTMEKGEKESPTSPIVTVTNAFLPMTSTLCVDFDSVF